MTFPDDSFHFWLQYPPSDAFDVVGAIVGNCVKRRWSGTYCGHSIIRIGYDNEFNLAVVEGELKAQLDAIGWVFVTTGEMFDVNQETFPCFAMAPIIPIR